MASASYRSPGKVGRTLAVGGSRDPPEVRVGRGRALMERSSHRRQNKPAGGTPLLRDYPKFTRNATYTIIVKRLPATITEHRLSSVFGRIGRVDKVKIIKTPTPTNNVYGFVNYVYFNDAKRAVMQLNKTRIGGSQIYVEMARNDAHPQQPRGEDMPHPQWSEGELVLRTEDVRHNIIRHGLLSSQPIPRSMMDKFSVMKPPFEQAIRLKSYPYICNSKLIAKPPLDDSHAMDSGYTSVGVVTAGGTNAQSSSSISSSPLPTHREEKTSKSDPKMGISDGAQVDNETEDDLPPLECPEVDSCDNDSCHSSLSEQNQIPLLDNCRRDFSQEDVACVDDDDEIPPLEIDHSDSNSFGSSIFRDWESDPPVCEGNDDPLPSNPSSLQTPPKDHSSTHSPGSLQSSPILNSKHSPDSNTIPLHNPPSTDHSLKTTTDSGLNRTQFSKKPDQTSSSPPPLVANDVSTAVSSESHDLITVATPTSLSSNNITYNSLPSPTQTTPPLKIGRGKMLLNLLEQTSYMSSRTVAPSMVVSTRLSGDGTPGSKTVQDPQSSAAEGQLEHPSDDDITVTSKMRDVTHREISLKDSSTKYSPIKSEPIAVPVSGNNGSLPSSLPSSLLADSSSIRPSTSPENQLASATALFPSANKGLNQQVPMKRGLNEIPSLCQDQQEERFAEASSKSLQSCEGGVSSSEEDEAEQWGTRFGRSKAELERSISTLERNIHRWQAELKRLQQKNVAILKEIEEAQKEEMQIKIHPDLIEPLSPERLREFDHILELEAHFVLTRESSAHREAWQKHIFEKAQQRYKQDKLALLELELAVKSEEVKWYLELAKLENKMLQAKAEFNLQAKTDFYSNF